MSDFAVDGLSRVDTARTAAAAERLAQVAQGGVVPQAAANAAQRLIGVAPHNGVTGQTERALCAQGLSAGVCNNPRTKPAVPERDNSQAIMAGRDRPVDARQEAASRNKAREGLIMKLMERGMTRADAEARVNQDVRFRPRGQ